MRDMSWKILKCTLNVNDLSTQVKRQRDCEIKFLLKQDPTMYSLQDTHFKYKDTDRLKVK